MGYTRYWNRTDKPITKEFVDEVNRIIEKAKEMGITVCNWDGEGKPTITIDEIAFNGKAPHMDHESFVINNDRSEFDFCKTARKPYDYVVKEVLKVAENMGLVDDVSDDGEVEVVTDKEYEAYYEEMKKKYPKYYK